MIRKKAFTLVELLISTAILSLVVLSLYSAFQVGLASYKRMDSASTVYQAARVILNRMELDLKNAFAYSGKDSGFKAQDKVLQFLILQDLFTADGLSSNICLIKYNLNGQVLTRICAIGLDALKTDIALEPDELSADIKELEFEYAYETDTPDNPYVWQKGIWPKEGDQSQVKSLPLAVKVKLLLIERDALQGETGSVEFSRIIPLAS
ncbi:MAG: prepilin-type N-terminal cleavage/methylation domain-containing protein [Candidatus Omnitrophota bacterium]